ncbi:hypothetical protein A2U01_0056807 [Trifolium medium]|uniref:Reverse transcriptase zinc-binding domain-containing protein n=1 Tax=Trifolium medium TaxID=97028 RepID=A0A392RIE3_9FABA|nr:hypothetical protein [Trifolium medium]
MHFGNANCRHCGNTPETTMHVLRDCPMAMMCNRGEVAGAVVYCLSLSLDVEK